MRFPWKSNMPTQLYRPVGCLECRMTGYAGRIGIYEIMTVGIGQAYWLIMMATILFFAYTLRKKK